MKKQVQCKIRSKVYSVLLPGMFAVITYGQGQSVGDQFDVDGITYGITSPAKVEVVGYKGTATEVTILETVNDQGVSYEVTRIGERAFQGKELTSVDFTGSSNVTSIGASAFRNNELPQVTIPDGVTSIGTNAFRNNELTQVIIPDGVTSIGTSAFRNNELIEVTIPDDVTNIGTSAFRNNKLTRVTISNTVNSIGINAFANNPIKIVTARGVATVPTIFTNNTFSNRLEIDVVVPEATSITAYENAGWTGFKSITEVAKIDGVFIADHITYQITLLEPFEVMATDYNTAGGTVVNIPETVDHGPNTYTVTAVGEDAFFDNQLTTIVVPESVTSLGQRAFGSNNQLTEVNIPDGVTSIPQWTFAQCNLKEVIIPANVEHIGKQAFFNNPNLDLVTMKRNNPPTTLDADAFQGLHSTNLRHQTDLVVPKGRVEDYENAGWTDFKSITEVAETGGTFVADHITYKITSMAPSFEVTTIRYDTAGGTIVNIPQTLDHGPNTYTVTSIGNDSFHGKGLTDVTIPKTVTSIGVLAFRANNLTSVTIPHDVTVILYGAFAGNQLTHVNIPTSVTTIGGFAFEGSQLTRVDIPETVTSIGLAAFRGNKLTEVTIPGSVPEIGGEAFSHNQLTRVTIPDGVTSIGYQAFAVNPLDLVTVEATVPPKLGATVFYDSHRHQIDLVVPTGKIQAYEAGGWTGFKSISDGSTPPRPVIDAPQRVDNLSLFPVSITFDGEVTGFELGDIQVTNATVNTLTGSGSAYTAILTPTSLCDDITIDIPANVVTGVNSSSNLPNLAATQVSVGTGDTIDPTITCPADVVANTADNGTGDCSTTVDLGSPVTDDNCSVAAVVAQVNGAVIDPDTYAFGTGATTVTWIVSDGAGNTASCEQTVTVHDDETPMAICQDITIQLDADGNKTITVDDIDNGSHDNCGVRSLAIDRDTFGSSDIGTNTVELTVTDINGNTATCSATVTVVEACSENLVAVARDITVQLDADGQVTISPEQVNNGSGSVCNNADLISLSLDKDTFTCDDVGTVTVVLTATQGSETATATALVTIEAAGNCKSVAFTIDAIADVTLQENTDYTSVTPVLSGDVKGAVTWTLGGTDAESFSIDGSTGVVTMIARDFETPADANTDNVYEVSITATDSERNFSETSWTVTVEDDPSEIPPQVPSSFPMIPTAFTPNGDGANDTWIIDDLSENASVRIYDRHGTIIFSSDDGYTRPWDGTYRGSSLPTGSYLYAIQDGPQTFKGTVTILL